MKKIYLSIMLLVCLCLTGCGSKAEPLVGTDPQDAGTEMTEAAAEAPHTDETGMEAEEVVVRVGSLKGPTSIGLAALIHDAAQARCVNQYADFTVAAAADELTTAFIKGDLDIVLLPANVASVLYNKTKGGATVIDINTLGVLYIVTGDTEIRSMQDLTGKTIYLTGKGTTPDYVLQYLLDANGISPGQVTLEYRSEATEIAAILSQNPTAVGLLPQPFATVALSQNTGLFTALDMTQEWEKIQGKGGGQLLTGVTIVRTEFLKQYPNTVEQFLKEHRSSTEFTEINLEQTAEYVVQLGIIAKEPLAQKAIPYCNIVCITGEEMKTSLQGYLSVLYEKDPAFVGGALPSDDFYYIP